MGKGYATEALQAFIPRLFDAMPSAAMGGYDYIEACTDSQNTPSQRGLTKCDFTRCETCEGDFVNPALGLRDSSYFRIARPGKTLQELGLHLG